jgi:diacylglycerol O-acyltransferase
MERMSGLDATFLYFETPTMHMHVCATIVFDPSTVPGGYSFEHIKETVAGRLHLAPPLRRRLAQVPFRLHHPVWIEDPNFDLDYHVRRVGCPGPGGERELAEVVGDIAGRQLDRTRPLWELWIVEGLDNGLVAAVAKVHHCTVDGVSGANLLVHFFDLDPDAAPREPAPAEWKPDSAPSDVQLVGQALLARAVRPLNAVRVGARTIGAITGFVRTRLNKDVQGGMAAPLTAPRTHFNVPITPHRRVAFARIPLDDVKAVKRAFGTTVNDVVLAIASGALRRYLEQRDDLPDKSLIATVPVSVRTDQQKATVGSNLVSAMFTSLRTDVDDPVERLMAISEANKGAKEEHKAIGADMLQNWAQFAAPTTFSLAARVYSGMKIASRHPVIHNLVISNVPGPQIPLYMAGAKLESMYPLGPVFDGAALNVTVLSYMDTVHWGFIACRETMPELWDLAAAVPDALAELRKAADTKS